MFLFGRSLALGCYMASYFFRTLSRPANHLKGRSLEWAKRGENGTNISYAYLQSTHLASHLVPVRDAFFAVWERSAAEAERNEMQRHALKSPAELERRGVWKKANSAPAHTRGWGGIFRMVVKSLPFVGPNLC